MADLEKFGLFLFIVGLSVVAARSAARLARETGVSAAVIGVAAGAIGHGLAGYRG